MADKLALSIVAYPAAPPDRGRMGSNGLRGHPEECPTRDHGKPVHIGHFQGYARRVRYNIALRERDKVLISSPRVDGRKNGKIPV